MRQSPTVKLRRLTIYLHDLRLELGLTRAEAAKLAGCAASQVTRLEARQIQPTRALVLKLLNAYGVADVNERERILALVAAADEHGWWHRYSPGLTEPHTTYIGLEHEARVLRTFEPQIFPGLMQLPEYTRGIVVGRYPGASPDFVQQRLDLRQKRQDNLLSGPDPLERLWVVIDEAVLYRPFGGRDAMVEQLEHVQKLASQDNVKLQVLPFALGAHAGSAPFVILTFKNPLDHEVVYLDTPIGELWCESKESVQVQEVTMQLMVNAALSCEDTILAIDAAIHRLARQPKEVGTRAVERQWIDLAEGPP